MLYPQYLINLSIMTDTKNYGIVYLLTNACMPGIVKIGKTSRTDLQNRMKELYTTGVPIPFECAYACRIKLSHMNKLESALHNAFEPNRLNKNREFFRIKPEQAMAIMQFVDNIQDATLEVSAEIANDMVQDDIIAIENVRQKRPPINFHEMGLHNGDTLVYVHDETKTVTISGAKKVIFDKKETSLTAITRVLLDKPYAVQPTRHWKFGEKNLSEIYDETYPPSEE